MANNQANLVGKIVHISEPRQLSANRNIITVVVEYQRMSNRVETVPIEFYNPERELFQGLGVGAKVIVGYQPGGSQSKADSSKYFPSYIGISINQI